MKTPVPHLPAVPFVSGSWSLYIISSSGWDEVGAGVASHIRVFQWSAGSLRMGAPVYSVITHLLRHEASSNQAGLCLDLHWRVWPHYQYWKCQSVNSLKQGGGRLRTKSFSDKTLVERSEQNQHLTCCKSPGVATKERGLAGLRWKTIPLNHLN